MFAFAEPRPRRRPSLTPMIDVVFLLLVFFMLAARFGQDGALPLSTGGDGGDWQGPPRLITVQTGALALNGATAQMDTLADRLRPLMPAPDAPVLLRAAPGADLARLVMVIDALRAAGFVNLVVVE